MWPLMGAKCFEDEKFSGRAKHDYSTSDVSTHLEKKKKRIQLNCLAIVL